LKVDCRLIRTPVASRHGSFFVTGNHEYYSGAHAWIAELRRLDITVLLNEHVVLRHGESEMVVAGAPWGLLWLSCERLRLHSTPGGRERGRRRSGGRRG